MTIVIERWHRHILSDFSRGRPMERRGPCCRSKPAPTTQRRDGNLPILWQNADCWLYGHAQEWGRGVLALSTNSDAGTGRSQAGALGHRSKRRMEPITKTAWPRKMD